MTPNRTSPKATPVPPPSKHQLAVMIWLAVFPTLVALNLALSSPLDRLPGIARTFVLVTIAVPIVIYGLMPQLHRLRAHLVTSRGRSSRS
jgi:antibiotic biosynthesis monooxygenase (ABM) superfamily enzyme